MHSVSLRRSWNLLRLFQSFCSISVMFLLLAQRQGRRMFADLFLWQPDPSACGRGWYLDFIVPILSALCLLHLLRCCTACHNMDSKDMEEKTALVMAGSVLCSTARPEKGDFTVSLILMQCLIHYKTTASLWSVSGFFLFPNPFRQICIWYKFWTGFFIFSSPSDDSVALDVVAFNALKWKPVPSVSLVPACCSPPLFHRPSVVLSGLFFHPHFCSLR